MGVISLYNTTTHSLLKDSDFSLFWSGLPITCMTASLQELSDSTEQRNSLESGSHSLGHEISHR